MSRTSQIEVPEVHFGSFPVYMGCTTEPLSQDMFWPMQWGINSSGLLSVVNPPPLEFVYPEQHNDPGISATWRAHHLAFADFLEKWMLDAPVLEIGAGNGYLARELQNRFGERFDWTVIEPNPLLDDGIQAAVIKGWFPDDLPAGTPGWSNICASHVLEHAPVPFSFLRDCVSELNKGGKLILTWPDMTEMARRTDLNMMNFEHLHFLPRETVEAMLLKLGMEITDVESHRGHSIFIAATKIRDVERDAVFVNPSTNELMTSAHSYKNSVLATIERMNHEIANWRGEIWVFGAHIFTQFLIAGGLQADVLSGVLDNSPGKQGKRLYGTGLEVLPPEALSGRQNVLILIAAALYEDEICEQLLGLDLSSSKLVRSRGDDVLLDDH